MVVNFVVSVPSGDAAEVGFAPFYVSVLPVRQNPQHLSLCVHSVRHRPGPLYGHSLPSDVSYTLQSNLKLLTL